MASESEALENTCRLMYAVLSYLVEKLDFNAKGCVQNNHHHPTTSNKQKKKDRTLAVRS